MSFAAAASRVGLKGRRRAPARYARDRLDVEATGGGAPGLAARRSDAGAATRAPLAPGRRGRGRSCGRRPSERARNGRSDDAVGATRLGADGRDPPTSRRGKGERCNGGRPPQRFQPTRPHHSINRPVVFWVYFLCEEKLTTNGVEPRVDHVWNHVWKHEGIPSVFTSVGLFGLFRSSTARGASRVLAMIVFSARVDARVCL